MHNNIQQHVHLFIQPGQLSKSIQPPTITRQEAGQMTLLRRADVIDMNLDGIGLHMRDMTRRK